jgi:hypothetical protein
MTKQKQLITNSLEYQVYLNLVASISLLGRGYQSETCLQQNSKGTEIIPSIEGRLSLIRVLSIWIIGNPPKL